MMVITNTTSITHFVDPTPASTNSVLYRARILE
jgi:hypothetical protein